MGRLPATGTACSHVLPVHGAASASPQSALESLLTDRLRPTWRAGSIVAALILATALMAGCRSAPASSGGSSIQRVTVKALDTMRFDPPTLTVPVGQPVQLTLVNEGALIHDIVLNEGAAQPVKIEAIGNSTFSSTVTIVRAGTYTYICAQPGHEAAGMKGTIVAR
jgi:plastocyanin